MCGPYDLTSKILLNKRPILEYRSLHDTVSSPGRTASTLKKISHALTNNVAKAIPPRVTSGRTPPLPPYSSTIPALLAVKVLAVGGWAAGVARLLPAAALPPPLAVSPPPPSVGALLVATRLDGPAESGEVEEARGRFAGTFRKKRGVGVG